MSDAAVEEKAHTLTGDIRKHDAFQSRFLTAQRTLVVYLPPGYDADPARRYPVLYMQDGQNLFDAATSVGAEWRMDETAQELISGGAIQPMIIVGIYNAGEERIAEYSPTRDSKQGKGGKADQYGQFIVEELKPFIDREYRTLADAANTGLGGSSLGGLLSMYLGLKYSGVFFKLAVISPSVWWDRQFIVRRVNAVSQKPPQRIWLSAGTDEGKNVVGDAARLRDALVAKGWDLDHDLKYVEIQGGRHDENAWATVVDPMLRFLFPPI